MSGLLSVLGDDFLFFDLVVRCFFFILMVPLHLKNDNTTKHSIIVDFIYFFILIVHHVLCHFQRLFRFDKEYLKKLEEKLHFKIFLDSNRSDISFKGELE